MDYPAAKAKADLRNRMRREAEKDLLLNTYKIQLAELRMIIVDYMKDGFTEIPLGDLLAVLRTVAVRDAEIPS